MDGRNNDRRKPDQDLHGPQNLIIWSVVLPTELSGTYIWIYLTISFSNAISPQRSPRFSPWQELNWLPVSFRGWHLTRSRGIGEIMMDQTRIQIQDIRISCPVFYKLSYLATVIKLACHMPPLKRLEWSSLLKILTSGSFPGRSEPVSLRGGHSTNCY